MYERIVLKRRSEVARDRRDGGEDGDGGGGASR